MTNGDFVNGVSSDNKFEKNDRENGFIHKLRKKNLFECIKFKYMLFFKTSITNVS